jgi:hypothetical protein
LTELSNVVAYACRLSHGEDRHHVHSLRRFGERELRELRELR